MSNGCINYNLFHGEGYKGENLGYESLHDKSVYIKSRAAFLVCKRK